MLRCFNDSLKLRRSVNGHVDDGVPTSWKYDTERLRLCPKGRYLASILVTLKIKMAYLRCILDRITNSSCVFMHTGRKE